MTSIRAAVLAETFASLGSWASADTAPGVSGRRRWSKASHHDSGLLTVADVAPANMGVYYGGPHCCGAYLGY